MGSYINYTKRINVTNKTDNTIINDVIDNQKIKVIQINDYVNDETLILINQVLKIRPDLTFRIFGFYQEKVCNLTFLKIMTNVQRLSIDCISNVTNLEIIKNLKLKSLHLEIYDLKDYAIIQELDQGLEELSLCTCIRSNASNFDCNWLTRFENLQVLYLAKAKKNLEVIKKLPQLNTLTLRGIKVNSLEFLKDSNVTNLSIHWCAMHDLSSLKNNQKLKSLELWRINKLSNLSFISSLGNLQTLRLIDLKNVETFPQVSNIKTVYLENIKNLVDITNLESANRIKEIEIIGSPKIPLEAMISLIKNKHCIIKGYGKKKSMVLDKVFKEINNFELEIIEDDKDLEQVKDLIIQYTKALNRDLSFQNLNQELVALKQKYTYPHGRIIVVKNSENKFVGCVGYYQHNKRRCEMKRLYVLPEYRGLKLGEKLVKQIIALAKQDGYQEMVLDTIVPLKALIGLYRKVGFKEMESYYHNPMDDVIYFGMKLV